MSETAAQHRGSNAFYGELTSRANAIEARYRALTPRSRALFERAGAVFPGGYTRDAFMRDPYAPFIESGQGSRMRDADGRDIVDFWFNATSLPLGHAHPDITAAVQRQAASGTAFFGPTQHELALAELLQQRLPGAERVRFTNSGSEAVMMAIRFARAARNRSLILKFEGSYHGSYDDVSWSVNPELRFAGMAQAPVAIAETAGLAGSGGRLAVLPFNDIAALESFVESQHDQLAAILVEPMANRLGLLLPDPAFLATARKLCDRHGIVLLFDEVIAFRVGYHGAQGEMGVTPDLTTLGKIIGGGFPVGAVVGHASILDLSAPGRSDRVTHAGTFNANPMTCVAGLATMQALTPRVFADLAALGAHVRRGLAEISDGLPLQITGAGSLFKITAVGHSIRNYRDAAAADRTWEKLASLLLYNEGFLLTPSLSGCVSAVTTREEADRFLGVFARVVTGEGT
jgi:glutamate-1-semialdehyde 2,1-aminomutase